MTSGVSKIVTGLALVWALGAQASAVAAAPSLSDMIAAALERNPGMALAEAQRGVAAALERKSGHPFAGAPSANLKYQTDALNNDLGYREWEGGVELPLWLPGQADAYRLEAGQTAAVADALRTAKRLEIAGEVRERLWRAAIARAEAEQAQVAVRAARELLDDILRRVDAGELPRSDRLLAEKALVAREEALQQATTRAAQADRLFSRYTGYDTPQGPPPESAHPSTEQPGPAHPQLALALARLEQARARRDRVAGERRQNPSLWVGGKTARSASDNDYEPALGIELSVPFGGGGHAAPVLAEAEAALTQAQIEYESQRLAIVDSVAEADLELARAEAAVSQAARRKTLADASLQLNRRAFELGEADLIRLLQAQADALAAAHDTEIRRLEQAQAAARLNQALGVIPE